ncbi:MAG: PDZ domain-containing protein [Candidatus Omnitrophica bacterium]|nr:PDZ domain-containing protein [Candidatus Omnitrophota bacterium]
MFKPVQRASSAYKGRGIVVLVLLFMSAVFIIYLKLIPMYFNAMKTKVWIGAETIDLTSDVQRQFSVPSSSGVLVARTFIDSPAQVAGIQVGDVIRRWNGVSITSSDELQGLIQAAQENQKVALTVDRQGQPVSVYIVVGTRP